MNRMRGERYSEGGGSPHHAQRTRRETALSGMTWPPALPFEQALQQARTADQHAMGLLYKRFLPVVYRYVLARVGDVHTAEDITSETFFAIVERIGETRAHDELTFVAWALGIARNQVAMHFRRAKSRPATQFSPSDGDNIIDTLVGDRDPLDVITARESLAEIATALERLTEEQRSVVLYRCVLGYSAEDVARLLGKQPGAIRALQFRALASLARFLSLAGAEVDEPAAGAARQARGPMGGE